MSLRTASIANDAVPAVTASYAATTTTCEPLVSVSGSLSESESKKAILDVTRQGLAMMKEIDTDPDPDTEKICRSS